MERNTLIIIEMVLILLPIGCGSHEITSSPPGAYIYTYSLGPPPHLFNYKPSRQDMRKALSFFKPIVTPHTFGGGPFSTWYQVRKEGYVDSDIVLLEGKEFSGKLSHHFVLKNSAVDFVKSLSQTVIDLNAKNGISNSSDAKMETVLQAVDELNKDNDVAAINTLSAFINAVNAQRGDKLSEEDADSLIGAAQHIIDLLTKKHSNR
jgi:hypothetical protein